ncbi:MAG: hypothetical protein DRR42_12855 [Gammaproteobacteria bacterium]|nr:MAG: hypothetical protein DRR42_12855 [Gammaproteobacteria bacterium]
MLPNFIIIGGQRCATGWIAQCLRDHPEIFMAQDETRFFDWNFSNGTGWWENNYFHSIHNETVIGEKTANYLTDENAPQRIHDTLPHAKIICCVRNPVERLYSAYMMKASRNPELKRLTLEKLIQAEPDLLERGRYSKHLKRYYRLLPKKNILTLLYDDKQLNPLQFIKSIYKFLGVNSNFKPKSLNMQTKPGARENKHKLITALSKKLLNNRSPFRKIYSALRTPSSPPNPWTAEEIVFLHETYNEEIINLEQLIGKNLSGWNNS